MGLDNGIRVRFKKLNEINQELISNASDYDFEEYEILYWRKRWDVRDKILSVLGEKNGRYEYYISKNEMIKIYNAYTRWLFEDTWDIEVALIWDCYEEILNFAKDMTIMKYLIDYWDKLEIEKIIFYDSY